MIDPLSKKADDVMLDHAVIQLFIQGEDKGCLKVESSAKFHWFVTWFLWVTTCLNLFKRGEVRRSEVKAQFYFENWTDLTWSYVVYNDYLLACMFINVKRCRQTRGCFLKNNLFNFILFIRNQLLKMNSFIPNADKAQL